MPPKSEKWKVRTTRELFDYSVFPRDGYVLPRKLKAHATAPDGTVADVEVEVANGRARARSVTVATEKPGGVGWTALAKVPIRNIVATACLDALFRVEVGDGEAMQLLPLRKADADDARQVVQGLVGYKPKYLEQVAS
jgi:hypothetical protein